MSNTLTIRSHINSVERTSKVTHALEMVAASRIRKTRALMRTSHPYVLNMRRLIAHVAQAHTDYHHPALVDRPVRRACYLVVASDHGLCGSLNVNLFHRVLTEVQRWQQSGVGIEIIAVGLKAEQFFRRVDIELAGSTTHLGDWPKLSQLLGVIKIARDGFLQGRVDRIHLAYNQFVNTLTQRPVIDVLIPLADAAQQIEHTPGDESHPRPETTLIRREASWDYLYEPDAGTVIGELLHRYVEAMVYQAVLENAASEQAARKLAMKAASDHADEAVHSLTLAYHRARQAAITEEIAEIVNGATAISG